MKLKTLVAVGVAAAFAMPFAAQASADNDRMILAQASGASSTGTGPTGGTASPQSAGEPKAPTAGERPRSGASSSGASSSGASSSGATAGTRGRPDFSAIDKNGDGQISRAEWDAFYKDRDQNRSGAAGGATSSGSAVTPSGSGKTGSTAGPGEASNRTAPGSATATKPDTSGQGKPQ
jgi:EF hand domain-containing protein